MTTGDDDRGMGEPDAIAGAWRTAVIKERTGGLSYALYANDGASHVAGYFNFGAHDAGPLSAAGALPLNTWTHVATT